MLVSTSPSKQLTAIERQYVLLTQDGMPIVSEPFHWLARQLNITVEQTFKLTEQLLERGVIRRIAAVPNHYKLGYNKNGMTVWDVDDSQVKKFGATVGKLPFVSHCYLRPRHLPRWNYNLFAMVHGKSEQEIQHYRSQIKELLKDVLVNRPSFESDDLGQSIQIKSNAMLTSTEILKKTGLRLKSKST